MQTCTELAGGNLWDQTAKYITGQHVFIKFRPVHKISIRRDGKSLDLYTYQISPKYVNG